MTYLQLFRYLWEFSEGHRWKIVVLVILHIASAGAMVLVPLVFAQILNAIQLSSEVPGQISGKNAGLIHEILIWSAVWVGLVLWFNLAHRLARYAEYDVGFHAKRRFFNTYYKTLTSLPMTWHTDHHSGDIINRLNLAANALEKFANGQYSYLPAAVNVFGPILILFGLSWQIATIVTFLSITSIWIVSRFDAPLIAAIADLNEKKHKISATLFDYLSNIRTILTLRLGRRTGREFDAVYAKSYRPLIHAYAWIAGWKWFVLVMLNMIIQIGIVLLYVWQKLSGGSQILIGNVAAVFQYVQNLTTAFGNVARYYQEILQIHTDLKAIEPILKAQSLLAPTEETSIIHDWRMIEVTSLRLHYAKQNEAQKFTALEDIGLVLHRGENIALTGESGAGKSSLMHVIRGVLAADRGCLTVTHDHTGNPNHQTSYPGLGPLSEITALIPQEPEIFEHTILYNITMGIEYTDEDIDQAIRLACFDTVIDRLDLGIHTDIREKGVNLSGGERQRLALARAILAAKNSSIILLDEPTSSVDMKTEEKIYDHILDHFKDCTIICSVHRLHLLDKFDRHIQMEQGKIL